MNIEEILTSGTFGQLELGQTNSTVQSLIGEPEGTSESKADLVIHKYGDLQLTFTESKLTQINLQICGTAASLPDPLGPFETELSSRTSPYEFLSLLEPLGVDWSVEQSLTIDRQLCIYIATGVFVFFDLDRRELTSLVIRDA